MRNPGVGAEKFFHLDGWNGWSLAFERSSDLMRTPAGTTLAPAKQLPGTTAEPGRAPPLGGLVFDGPGYAIAVSPDGLCRLDVCGDEARRLDPPPCWPRDLLGATDVARSGRGRLYVTVPEQDRLYILRSDPMGLVGARTFDAPVAVAVVSPRLDAAVLHPEQIWLLTRGALVRIDPEGRPLAHFPLPAPANRLAVSSTGTIFVGRSGTRAVWSGPPNALVRHVLERSWSGTFEVDADGHLRAGDTLTGRVVQWDLSGPEPIPLGWTRESGSFVGATFRAARLVAVDATCALHTLELEPEGFVRASGSFIVGPLDAKSPRVEWHRLVIRATRSTHLRARVLADDDCLTLDGVTPEEVRADPRWSAPRPFSFPRGDDIGELLMDDTVGRFAFVEIELLSDGRRAPLLEWLRVEYPRVTYLRFLPAVFSEDPASRDLLARFLSMFEASNVEVARTIDEAYRFFSTRAGTAEQLEWLAERIGFVLEPDWPVATKRRALSLAFALYRMRGTRWALERYLELYGASDARIVEAFAQRRSFLLGGTVTLGCDSIMPGSCGGDRIVLGNQVRLGAGNLDSKPYPELGPISQGRGKIIIYLGPTTSRDPDRIAQIDRMVQREKPAGVEAELRVAPQHLALGQLGRLGLDATLGRHAPWVLTNEPPSTNAMLLTRAPETRAEAQVGIGPRLGMGAKV